MPMIDVYAAGSARHDSGGGQRAYSSYPPACSSGVRFWISVRGATAPKIPSSARLLTSDFATVEFMLSADGVR
jgi:hypothetical protein